MKAQRFEVPDFGRGLQGMRRLGRDFPKAAGVTAVNFFKDRFQRQGWQDERFERWPARRSSPPGGGSRRGASGRRQLLVKTGRLKRSIRIQEATWGRVVVATDVPYARAHNEGVNATVSQTVRAHKVRSFPRRRAGRTETVREHTRQGHTRTIRMVLPRRQFMGNANLLNRRIQMQLHTALKRLETDIFK
jgi:phage gpG-like protein